MADAIAKLTDTATTAAATADLEAKMYGVEVDVLELIAERLGKVTKDTTYADVAEMVAKDMPRISKLLDDAGITASEFIEALYDEMASLNDEWAAEYYEARGLTQAKVTEDAALSAALKSGKFTVESGIVNLCNSSVAMIVDENGAARPIAEAYRQAVNDVVRAMVGGETTKAKAVQDAVRALSSSGIRVQYGSGQTRELYSAVRQNVEEGYRTTMQSLRDEQGRKFGADGVEISAHSQCAPDHQKIQGRQYTNAEFEKLNSSLDRPIGKYNCVIGSTLVCGPDCTAAYRRPYSGKLVRIRTAGGHDLTVTPNHPILTSHGWVSAESVAKGDNVFCRCSADGMFLDAGPDDDNGVSAIEYKFKSLCDMFECVSVPSCSEDFHGDGIVDEEINVVFTDGKLRDDVSAHCGEFGKKHPLASAVVARAFGLLGLCSLTKRFISSLHSSNGVVRVFGELSSLVCGHSGKPSFHCVASILSIDSHIGKPIANGHLAYSDNIGDLALGNAGIVKTDDSVVISLDALPIDVVSKLSEPAPNDLRGASDDSGDGAAVKTFFVKLDDVVDVNVYSGTCHVYNLSTVDEWYFANDILTHNCRHMTFPVIVGVSSKTYSKADRDEMIEKSNRKVSYTDQSGKRKHCTAYEFTQVQRELETRIRKLRTEARLLNAAKQDSSRVDAMVDELTDHYKAISRQAKVRTRLERTGIDAE